MLFAADYYERSKRRLKPGVKDLNEAINIVSGLNTKGMENTFKWMDGLYTLATDQSGQRGRRSAETVLKAFGDWFSAFATPIQQLSDLTGEFDEHQRRMKEQYGLGAGTLFAPTLNKLPSRIPGTGIDLRDQLNDQIDPYTGGPVYRSDHPFARQFGFNMLARMPQVQQIFFQAGIRTPDWAPYVGVPEIDRELTGEIGKWANENSQLILDTVADMPYDEQVAILHRTFTDAGRAAYNTVLSRYPDVQRRLTDTRSMSYWEQRVADKQRALDGLPSRESEYQDLQQDRMAEPPPKLLPRPEPTPYTP